MSATASAGLTAGRSEVAALLARFGIAASCALSYVGLEAANAMVAAGELAEYRQGLGSTFKRVPPPTPADLYCAEWDRLVHLGARCVTAADLFALANRAGEIGEMKVESVAWFAAQAMHNQAERVLAELKRHGAGRLPMPF